MNDDAPEWVEDRFAHLLAEYDDALAAGITPTPGDTDMPADMQSRMERDLPCLQLLAQLRPRRSPHFPTPLIASAAETLVEKRLTTLGRFEIRGVLGRGGYGTVYLAYDPTLSREVALKVPRVPALASPGLRARFRQEARVAAGLEHPNIVAVYEAGEVDSICYIASAYCPGITLAQWISQRAAPAPAREAAALIAVLADAVHHAHSRGVLHRDLKPTNVLLSPINPSPLNGGSASPLGLNEAQAKITDFGLAKFLADEADGNTASGEIVGTPWYMAPEQAEGKRHAVTTVADVYSLGAILYELLTGRPPFQGDTALAVLEQVRWHDPTPPRRIRSQVPRDLDTICLKCLEKNPERRYASAYALADDLRRFLNGEPVQARAASIWDHSIKWARRRPALAALLAVAATAFVAIGAREVWNYAQLRTAWKAEERQRQRAQVNFDKAWDAVQRMLTEVAEVRLNQVPQLEPVRRQLLLDALDFYQGFVDTEGNDPAIRRETARAFERVAFIHRYLGDLAKAESAAREGIAVHESLVADFPHSAVHRHDLANCCIALSLVLRATGDRLAEAETLARRAAQLASEARARDADDPSFLVALARSRHSLGELLRIINHLEEQAIHHNETALNANPKHAAYRQHLCSSYRNLAEASVLQGDHQTAAEYVTKAVDTLPADGRSLVRAAGILAECADIVARSGVSEQDQLGKTYADRAMQLLNDVARMNYRELSRLTTDKQFDRLRSRQDFQALVLPSKE